MYVVRRAFRNNGSIILPGSTVEPGNVKRFKTRLKDRDIVEVNAHNFKQWEWYFKNKLNVKITMPEQNDAEPTIVERIDDTAEPAIIEPINDTDAPANDCEAPVEADNKPVKVAKVVSVKV